MSGNGQAAGASGRHPKVRRNTHADNAVGRSVGRSDEEVENCLGNGMSLNRVARSLAPLPATPPPPSTTAARASLPHVMWTVEGGPPSLVALNLRQSIILPSFLLACPPAWSVLRGASLVPAWCLPLSSSRSQVSRSAEERKKATQRKFARGNGDDDKRSRPP